MSVPNSIGSLSVGPATNPITVLPAINVNSITPTSVTNAVVLTNNSLVAPGNGVGSGVTPGVTLATSSQPSPQATTSESQVLDRKRLGELVREIDPSEQLDEDVEDILLQIADDFIEQTVGQACMMAKHRQSSTVEVRDVQLVLERSWNMWIPGFGTEDIRPHKRSSMTEAHRQRLALIKKTMKKY